MINSLHITPSVRMYGARRSLLSLVKGLKASGRYNPLVMVPRQGGITDELDRAGVRWTILELPPWRKGKSWLKMPQRVAALQDLIIRENIGLVHCNEIYPNPHAIAALSEEPPVGGKLARWAMLANRLGLVLGGARELPVRIPVVTHMRLSVTPDMVLKYALVSATRIVAVSEAAARDFDPFSWKEKKVRVVYNGIELEDFERARSTGAGPKIRTQLGWGAEHFIIGQIGLLSDRKRPRWLIEQMPELLRRIPNARALFVGDPSPSQNTELDKLKSFAESLGVFSAVQFVPFQNEIAPWFAALDLHMLVSNDEGFGRTIIEAAAAGVPTVGAKVGGIPELIESGKTGLLLSSELSANDAAEFQNFAAQAANDRESLRRLGEAAHLRAATLFSARSYIEGVERVFDQALSAKK